MIPYKLFEASKEEGTELLPSQAYSKSELNSIIKISKDTKPSIQNLTLAINYGMIIKILYQGLGDKSFHTRTIYPMVLGKSGKDALLLRAWQLEGFSLSNGGQLLKDWRLFRVDRMRNFNFSGKFYRLTPDGYAFPGDKAMKGGIISQADFEEIEKLQSKLIKSGQIFTSKTFTIPKTTKGILVKKENSLFINNPYIHPIFKNKDTSLVRFTYAQEIENPDKKLLISGIFINKDTEIKMKVNNTEIMIKALSVFLGSDFQKPNIKKNLPKEIEVYSYQRTIN